MSSRQSRRYLSRVRDATLVQPNDLSAEAESFVRSPGPRLAASVFQELLAKGYVEPQGRTWQWTMRAKAMRAKA